MKKVFRFLGIIAILAVIGFSMVACGGNDDDNSGGGGGGSSGGNTLSGTYYREGSSDVYITFSSNGTWNGRYAGDSRSGTYTLRDLNSDGSRYLYMRGDIYETWTLYNAKTIMSKDGEMFYKR